MTHQTTLAYLNLHAVLPNLEALVTQDTMAQALVKDWDICIQFIVRKGPRGYVDFKNGTCRVGSGPAPRSGVSLFFTSCAHLNKMFNNQANPIPVKGFTKLAFVAKSFPKITDRLEYFLRPTAAVLENPEEMTINTVLTLYTAARAVTVLAVHDPVGKTVACGMPDGALTLGIQPDGPSVSLIFQNGSAEMMNGTVETPMACLAIKDMKTANDFLNQKIDAFSAISLGAVSVRGQLPMIDSLDLMLERIPCYL